MIGYIIKKGKHYSGFRFRPFIKCEEVIVTVKFTDSCRHSSKNIQLSEQVNKLCGFGSIFHHRNSIRIGWRYDKETGVIVLYLYEYLKGKRIIKKFSTIGIGETKKLRLTSRKPFWFGKFLFPYFGGKASAPKDIKILLDF